MSVYCVKIYSMLLDEWRCSQGGSDAPQQPSFLFEAQPRWWEDHVQDDVWNGNENIWPSISRCTCEWPPSMHTWRFGNDRYYNEVGSWNRATRWVIHKCIRCFSRKFRCVYVTAKYGITSMVKLLDDEVVGINKVWINARIDSIMYLEPSLGISIAPNLDFGQLLFIGIDSSGKGS